MLYKASAPGSLMLLGEYGVLFGKQALIAAIDQRIHGTLSPRTDQRIIIHSPYGTHETKLHHLSIEPPFHFVLHAIQHVEGRLRFGFELTLHSDFSDQVGLGSSAAVTVCVLALLNRWMKMPASGNEFIRQARTVVRRAQDGAGSGADVAASVHGGIVAYQTEPIYSEKFTVNLPLSVIYSGHKKKTTDTIHYVKNRFLNLPHLFLALHKAIGQCATAGIQSIRKQDWNELGMLFQTQQGLMQSLGVSTPFLNELIESLESNAGILGAKISGSGLGDCVIALGQTDSSFQPKAPAITLSLNLSTTGAVCEEI